MNTQNSQTQIGFRASEELRSKLIEIAQKQGRTLSNLLKYIAQQFITFDEHENKVKSSIKEHE